MHHLLRDRSPLVPMHLLQILAVVAGGVWWQSRSILSLAGAPFFLLLNQSFMSVIATTRVFPPQRNLMLRETSLGYYGVIPYFLAQNVYDSAMCTWICPCRSLPFA